MAVSQASHGCVRSSWKYTHTGKRVSAGAVCVALLRSVDGELIAGAALLCCCAGAFVSAALCEVVEPVFSDVVDDVVDAVVVAGAGNFMEGARSAPTRSRAAKVVSGICARLCDLIMNHGGGFAIAIWNFF